MIFIGYNDTITDFKGFIHRRNADFRAVSENIRFSRIVFDNPFDGGLSDIAGIDSGDCVDT